ncbi:uncharacterized protein LOC131601845 [Vicia villosa]|uniref:uncharacterized protein LOC131601845 n=1 Tax=Vicia villosa TaxID=3911 RepID=UPI00273BA870|nr:uncharacterized protein LOC131601845 [Vicia villosa]
MASSSNKIMIATYIYLPDECWEFVFKFLIEDEYYNPKSLSLVSKQFLSITNRLQYSLLVREEASSFMLRRLFRRFSNLNSIHFPYYTNCIDHLLIQISQFSLNITSLNLSTYQSEISASGLIPFSQKITTLTSLTCSFLKYTDFNLIAQCFPLLQELDLSFPKKCSYSILGELHPLEPLSLALFKLRKVNFTGHSYIDDQTLFLLFKNWKFLEEAILFDCYRLTNSGIVSAVAERPTLRSFSFTNYFEPQDCSTLPQLESLRQAHNSRLRDERIKVFASVFPNLQLLDLNFCTNISEEGIFHILRRCCKIKHLNLFSCLKVKLLGMNFETPKLEVLNLSHTPVDDETLYVISKNCRRLLQLLVEHCNDVTGKGVKHVLENCSQLKEINLRGCLKVHKDLFPSLVFSRPSLRKIIVPVHYLFSDKELKLMSRQGCLFCK